MSAISPSDPVELRRELHAHPELAHREERTAERIVGFLSALGADEIRTGVGGTGVVATYVGDAPGPEVLFRAELDALPIDDLGVVGHRSVHAGVAHKCGHDGHMAILGGLGVRLAADRPARGAVHLLFQPAEETGTGAARMLDDPAFSSLRPDLAVALHNMPGFPLHSVVVRPGSMTAAVRSIVIRLRGREAHASEPEHGVNPGGAVSQLLAACAELSQLDPTEPGFRAVVPVHARLGQVAYGIAPGDAEVHVTMRAWTDTELDGVQRELDGLAHRCATGYGLGVTIEEVERFAATHNDPEIVDLVVDAARSLRLDVIRPPTGMRAGEDFGLFGERFPVCLALIGAGEHHPPIHDPEYDFPDELIPTGVDLLAEVVRRRCR